MSILLSGTGVQTDEALNGKKACELCLKNNYDLVLMDLFMPVKNGFQSAEMIRNILGENSPKLVAISGDNSLGIYKKARDAGFISLISKPFNYLGFFEEIGNILEIQWVFGSDELKNEDSGLSTVNDFAV